MGVIRKLNRHGDTPTAWDTADPATIAEAERIFAAELDNGNTAYARRDGTDTVTRKFDPEAEEIVIVSPLQGG